MFTFRFETLLSARRNAEDIFQKELAEARRTLAVEQTALRDLRGNRRRCMHELHRIQQLGFHASDVQLYEPYLARLEREIDRQKKRAASAERKMIQKRSDLMDAVKKRKMLEKLKDKDLRAHLDAIALSERKFMDDVAVIFSKSSTYGGGFGEN
jgi:flagellar protein FliJ